MSRQSDFPLGVDTILRLHDPGRLLEFDSALFSLINQTFAPVHPIIVTQAFDAEATAKVSELLSAFDWVDRGHQAPSLVNVPAPAGSDIRARLLNVGIGLATNRFLAFLDGDDYLYGHAYDHLIEQALGSGAAIAFGDIICKEVRVFNQFIYVFKTLKGKFKGDGLMDLLRTNFCPIHSFVADRNQISSADLTFNADLCRLEDYDFLLRLCSKYTARFESRGKVVGVYNWHLDGRGSITFAETDGAQAMENRRMWNAAYRFVWDMKTTLRSQYSQASNLTDPSDLTDDEGSSLNTPGTPPDRN